MNTKNPTLHQHSHTDEQQGTALVMLAGMILGTMGIFVLEAGQDPMTTVAFRCVFGCLSLLLWGTATKRLPELKLSGKALLGAMLTGVLMVSSWALHFAAIPKTSIGVSTVVFHIQPFITMALGMLLLRESVSSKQIWLTVLAFLGLILTTGLFTQQNGLEMGRSDYLLGILLSFVGSVVYAFVPLLAKTLKSVSSFALVWWQCGIGAILTIWWPLWYGWPALDSLGWLIGLGAIHSGLAYVLMFAGFAHLNTGRMAVLQFVYPMTAFVVDWYIYGHALSAIQMMGLLLMGVAIWSIKRG